MDNTLLLAGLLIILFGFIVKKFVNMILGYVTLSADRKAQVDVDALSTSLRNILFRAGGVVIVCSLNWTAGLLLAVLIPLIVIFMVIETQKYLKK